MAIELTDPLIRDILVGIVGNGLWTLTAQSGGKALKEIKALVSPPKSAALTAIRGALDQLQKSIESRSGNRQVRLISYLKSPEVESIVRQLFATSLIGSTEASTFEGIKGEFLSSMSHFLDIDEDRLQLFAEAVFDGLLESAESALQNAIVKNVLSAHEAMDAARHRMLLDEISNIKGNIALLAAKSTLDVTAILQFEEKYRQQVSTVHAFIKPPHLESGRRVPIDEIFVAPEISPVTPKETQKPEPIELPSFLSGLYRAVLLGNPGGGKSTAATKICYDLATRYSERLFAGREVTPVLVVLREFGSQKKTSGCSIAQFIEQQASSRYQISPPKNAFEYLLMNGRLLVIFDGLDELLDTSYRQEITSNVEAFCKLHPSVPILVTSRQVGYEQAPLNEKQFGLFHLAPFNEEQVKEYASKWFARDEDFTPEQRVQKARAFFADSSLVPDLRSNPLMLGLMCNLYRVEGYIPRNRPEVYSKCSIMLFERWDKGRDILVPLPFEEHLRPAMEDLAFWIYSNDNLQGGVTESGLVEKSSQYLNRWVFEDINKSSQASVEFIKFCTGRAWVFTDTGTTAVGERLFQFTHRTFLEYFTACHLVSIHPTPEPLATSLKGHIEKREWDVVAQLSFQILSKRVQGAADELLDLLLAGRYESLPEKRNALSFAERSLAFLVPSPRVRREITQEALSTWLARARTKRVSGRTSLAGEQAEVTEPITDLITAAAENRSTVIEEVEVWLKRAVNSSEIDEAALAAELCLAMLRPANMAFLLQFSEDAEKDWHDVAARVIKDTELRIREIAGLKAAVAVRCCWENLISASQAVSALGIPFLVLITRGPAVGSSYFAYGFGLVGSALGAHWAGSKEERVAQTRQLDEIADVFLRTPAPWISKGRRGYENPGDGVLGFTRGDSLGNEKPIKRSPRADFSIMCLLAVEVELIESKALLQATGLLKSSALLPANMRTALLGRQPGGDLSGALNALESFSFDEPQKTLLSGWIRHDFDLVEHAATRRTITG